MSFSFQKRLHRKKFYRLQFETDIKILIMDCMMDYLTPRLFQTLYFHFLSNWMGYGRGYSFLFDFEPNWIPFGSKSKGKLSPRSYPIQFERKWKYIFISEYFPIIFQQCCILPPKHYNSFKMLKYSGDCFEDFPIGWKVLEKNVHRWL